MDIVLYGRAAFLAVFKPRVPNITSAQPLAPRYSATILFPKGGETDQQVRALIKRVAEEKWKEKAEGILRHLSEVNALCYRTKPRVNKDGVEYPGFENAAHISASSVRPVAVLGRQREPLTEADNRPYPGCWVNAHVDIWALDKPGVQRRIVATLLGVQFVKDDEPFGAFTVSSPDRFPRYEAEESAETAGDVALGDEMPF